MCFNFETGSDFICLASAWLIGDILAINTSFFYPFKQVAQQLYVIFFHFYTGQFTT